MRHLRSWLARAIELFRRRHLERDLADELQQHLDLLTEDFVRHGLSPVEARQAARRELGGIAHVTAAVGDARGFRWLDSLVFACRLAFRRLTGSPAFSVSTVIILALGIGVTTGIFSVVDAVLLRPLPYPAPGQLVTLVERNRSAQTGGALAPANLVDYSRRSRTVARFATFSRTGRNVSGATDPERLAGEEVDASYFATLGVAPAIGREIQDADLDDGAPAVAVVSHGVWTTRFGRQPDVLTKDVVLDGIPHRVVGVMPPEFRGASDLGAAGEAAFWVPLKIERGMRERRTEFILSGIGRLAPGASVQAARAELAAISEALAIDHPELGEIRAVITPMGEEQFAAVRPLLVSLLAAVGLVLLIACVNTANLLVVRAAGRHREIAVRFAMGASRTRVIGELLVESVLLGMVAGMAALMLGAWTTNVLVSLAPASLPRIAEVTFDLRSFVVTGSLGLAVGLLFGLLPAFQVSRAEPADVLRATDRRAGGGWLSRSRTLLLTVEVTLSIVLLVGAGLMTRSLMALNDVDLGFNPNGVLNATIPLPNSKYGSQPARYEFFARVADRAASIPGVTTVAFANGFPMRGGWTSGFIVEPLGSEAPLKASVGFQAVSPDFFRTLGIRLIRGRTITIDDRATSEPVAIVSEAFQPTVLSGADPLGRRIRRGPQAPAIRIVGIVSDIRRGGRTASIDPQVYLPAAQTTLYPARLAELAVRVDGDPAALIPRLRDAVWSVDPAQPLVNIRTLDETLALRQAERHFQTLLFGLFALLALVLAITGVYSLAAYVVSQRTPEIGVRIALGADRVRILAWIVRQSLTPIAVGTAVGIVVAVALSNRVTTLLFSTSPLDPVTYVLAAAALIAAALAAILVAGRSATRIDPVSVLK